MYVNEKVTWLAAVAFLFVNAPGCSKAPEPYSGAPQAAPTAVTAASLLQPAPSAVTAAAAAPVSNAAFKRLEPHEFARFFAAPISGGWRFPTPYHFHEWRLAAGISGHPRFLTDATGARQALQVGWAPPRIVFLIDDLGNARTPLRVLEALPFVINGAILPHTVHAAFAAASIGRAGGDVLLHLPLQPVSYPKDNPGPGALWVTMPVDARNQTLAGDWRSVPHAIGFNNHMGSLFTATAAAMDGLGEASRELGPVFLDSRTIPHSVAVRHMLAYGIPSLGRTHFLDDNPGDEAVSQRLDEAIRYAKRNGVAIAIGHPNRSTLRVLAQAGERLANAGVTAVAIHEIYRLR